MTKPRPTHSRTWIVAAILIGALMQPARHAAAQETSSVPVYVRIDSGWLGLFGHGNEHVRFPIRGRGVQIQDASHVMVRQGLGLMVTFVEKNELTDVDLLPAHAHWEAAYWREHAARVDTATRVDLLGSRHDMRVTELRLWNSAGKKLLMYVVGLRGADGVFAFGFSTTGSRADAVVSRFVRSLELVHRPLTPAEAAQVADSVKR